MSVISDVSETEKKNISLYSAGTTEQHLIPLKFLYHLQKIKVFLSCSSVKASVLKYGKN